MIGLPNMYAWPAMPAMPAMPAGPEEMSPWAQFKEQLEEENILVIIREEENYLGNPGPQMQPSK